MTPFPADSLVVSGARGEVRYAVKENGEMLAKEFIDGLPVPDKSKLFALFRRLAVNGTIHNVEKFRKERGEIYAFKSAQIRIPCFRVGNRWFLTHGFTKNVDRWKKADLDRADKIRQEHLDQFN